jgi:hypothetical protein
VLSLRKVREVVDDRLVVDNEFAAALADPHARDAGLPPPRGINLFHGSGGRRKVSWEELGQINRVWHIDTAKGALLCAAAARIIC